MIKSTRGAKIMGNTTKFMLLIAAPFVVVTAAVVVIGVIGVTYLITGGC